MVMKKDTILILGAAALRSAAISFSSVLLGLYLAARGFDAAVLTTAVAFGLAGCAAGIGFAHWAAVRWGERRTLALVSFLMACGGMALAWSASPAVVFFAAFLGMLNGMGRDRGAGLTIDQTMLPALVSSQKRTWLFSWYSLVSDAGNAVGALCAALPVLLRTFFHAGDLASYQWAWAFYSLICLCAGVGSLCLSSGVEHPAALRKTGVLSKESCPKVFRFAALSGLDSFGGGFLSTALIGYWFFQRFGLNEAVLAPLFFAARCTNGLSHLGAAWLAKRIGLVNTMVFTHIPSSLLLMTVPIAPNFAAAAGLFLLRETFVEMDLPTRQSYLMSIVPAHDRTAAAALTNGVRVSAWTVGALLAGPFMALAGLSAPLIAGAGLKIVYDLVLYRDFRRIRPPEENA